MNPAAGSCISRKKLNTCLRQTSFTIAGQENFSIQFFVSCQTIVGAGKIRNRDPVRSPPRQAETTELDGRDPGFSIGKHP